MSIHLNMLRLLIRLLNAPVVADHWMNCWEARFVIPHGSPPLVLKRKSSRFSRQGNPVGGWLMVGWWLVHGYNGKFRPYTMGKLGFNQISPYNSYVWPQYAASGMISMWSFHHHAVWVGDKYPLVIYRELHPILWSFKIAMENGFSNGPFMDDLYL